LTAQRSTTNPLAASVRLKAFVQRGGAWSLSDQVLVGQEDGWFWFPLTGSGAVCGFSTANTNPAPIAVSLLVTPSIGCAPTEHFQLRDGRFSAVGSGARKLHGGVNTGGGGMAYAAVTQLGRVRGRRSSRPPARHQGLHLRLGRQTLPFPLLNEPFRPGLGRHGSVLCN
jgi:hypothetical protein